MPRKLLLVSVIWILFGISLSAVGIEPAVITLNNLPLGSDINLSEYGVNFFLVNTKNLDSRLKLSFDNEISESLLGKIPGYVPLPDLAWIKFDMNGKNIAPRDREELDISINIPEQYYNCHFLVLPVGSDHGSGTFGGIIRGRYYLETEAKADVEEPPYGEIGVVPSVLNFDEIDADKEYMATFKLYNSTGNPANFNIVSGLIDNSKANRGQVLSAAIPFKAYDNEKDISLPDMVTIPAMEYTEIPVTIYIPDEARYLGGDWETVVWVVRDDGIRNFVRIHFTVKS